MSICPMIVPHLLSCWHAQHVWFKLSPYQLPPTQHQITLLTIISPSKASFYICCILKWYDGLKYICTLSSCSLKKDIIPIVLDNDSTHPLGHHTGQPTTKLPQGSVAPKSEYLLGSSSRALQDSSIPLKNSGGAHSTEPAGGLEEHQGAQCRLLCLLPPRWSRVLAGWQQKDQKSIRDSYSLWSVSLPVYSRQASLATSFSLVEGLALKYSKPSHK